MAKAEQSETDTGAESKADGHRAGPSMMTTEEMLRPKWLQRQKLIGEIELLKAKCKEMLNELPWYQQHKEEIKAIQMQVELIERSMDECARLGKQVDFLAESESE